MQDELKKNFESLLKNGEYAEAEKLLVPYMKENPDDWDAKLLYGTCRMMQGDAETAKQIHDEVEKQIAESGKLPEEQKSFWDKYKKIIFYGAIGTALVLGGYAGCVKTFDSMFDSVKYDGPRDDLSLYADPVRKPLEHKQELEDSVKNSMNGCPDPRATRSVKELKGLPRFHH